MITSLFEQLQLQGTPSASHFLLGGQLFDNTIIATLRIGFEFDGRRVTWTPAAVSMDSLHKIRHVPDQGSIVGTLQERLLSRDGWSRLDDSRSPVRDQERRIRTQLALSGLQQELIS